MSQSSPSTIPCSACGFHPPVLAAFCPQCGHELPPSSFAQPTDLRTSSSAEHTLDNLPAMPPTTTPRSPAQATVQISPLTLEKFQDMVREIQGHESLHPPPSPLPSPQQTLMLEPDILTRIKSQGLSEFEGSYAASDPSSTLETSPTAGAWSPGATATYSADLSAYLLPRPQATTTPAPSALSISSPATDRALALTDVYQRAENMPDVPVITEHIPEEYASRSSAAQRTMVMDDDNIQAWIRDMGVSLSLHEEQRIDDAAETLAQAEHAVDQQEYAKAIDLYLALIRSFPEQTQYQERLSELWLQLRDEKSLPAPTHRWFRSPVWLWFSATMVLFFVVWLAAGFFGHKSPMTQPLSAPHSRKPLLRISPKPATLQIQSIPEGASIWLNQQSMTAATPTSFDRPAGEYQLMLKKPGFRPMQMRVKLREGQFFAVAFALTPEVAVAQPRPVLHRRISSPRTSTPPTRNIRFTSHPSGASILLDDRDISRKTPTTLRLRHGEYLVHFRLSGYQNYIRAVRVDAETESTVHTELGQQKPSTRTLLIETEPRGANIAVNQNDTGKKTPVRLEVPTSTFTLQLTLAGYQSIQQTVVSDNNTSLRFVLKPSGPVGMKWIAPGFFWMGNNTGTEREKPMHKVYLRGFWIDQHEVTAQQYRECVQQKVCRPVPNKPNCQSNRANDQQHPIRCVNWYDAQTYCRWQKKRLPTEAEWEKAARGPTPRLYPWGHASPSCKRAHYAACGSDGTRPVGSLPAGRSIYGLYDMSGNVWEWVQDRYDRNFYRKGFTKNPVNLSGTGNYRVIRGGAWNSPEDRIHTTYRADYWAFRRTHTVGFRCAK